MKIVLQRVSKASVSVEGKTIGAIDDGFLILLGVSDKMVDKLCKLRIFQDENGKTNRSLADVGGQLLVVSQFTLYADCSEGNRPSFFRAGAPDLANRLYEHVVERCRMYVDKVEHGEFGAYMQVELLNDGPFTLVLDSDMIVKKKKN